MTIIEVKPFNISGFRKALKLRIPNKIDPNLKRNLRHGWLLPYLVNADLATWGRWDYWIRMMEAKTLLEEPIPEIDFEEFPGGNERVRNHLEKCLDLIPNIYKGGWLSWSSWRYMDYFIDWLLYGFGCHLQKELPAEPPGCEGASMRLYQIFDLNFLVGYPYDYFGYILSANNFGKSLGFEPTPFDITQVLMRVSGLGLPGKDYRLKTVYDCCLGTGRLLLLASNYSLRLYGQELHYTIHRAAIVNGYLNAPWMVKPFPFLDDLPDNNIVVNANELPTFGQYFTEEDETIPSFDHFFQ